MLVQDTNRADGLSVSGVSGFFGMSYQPDGAELTNEQHENLQLTPETSGFFLGLDAITSVLTIAFLQKSNKTLTSASCFSAEKQQTRPLF